MFEKKQSIMLAETKWSQSHKQKDLISRNLFVSFCVACMKKLEIKAVSGSFRKIIMISDYTQAWPIVDDKHRLYSIQFPLNFLC